MAGDVVPAVLRDLLLTTKDGDWGKESPTSGFVPYRVIRGTDFPSVRIGNTSSVPVRYLSEPTVHRRTLRPDDILLETAGGSPGRPTGRSLLITKRLLSSLDLPATCASFARFLRVDPSKADPHYVYWHLQYLYATGQVEEHQVQHTGVARFQYTKFAETERIPLPAPDDQRAIAHILGTLDDKIELNRRTNETLEAMARALFKSWFIDFDPVRLRQGCGGQVRAKSEGRDPLLVEAVAKAGDLPQPLVDLFPDSFEDSELGEIPKGWEVRGLDDVAHFLNGLALQKHPPKDGRSLPVIKIAQLRAGDTAGADAADADLDPHYVVNDGDVLFSWSGSLECVLWTGGRGALNQHLFKVTSTEFPKCFYYLWIHQHLADFRHIAAGKATTMGHIQRHHLSDAKVVVPDRDTLKAASDVLSPLLGRIITTRIESRTLAALRDTLLPKLISGELRVKNTEPSIQEVTV